jgi:hypothetical protein
MFCNACFFSGSKTPQIQFFLHAKNGCCAFYLNGVGMKKVLWGKLLVKVGASERDD